MPQENISIEYSLIDSVAKKLDKARLLLKKLRNKDYGFFFDWVLNRYRGCSISIKRKLKNLREDMDESDRQWLEKINDFLDHFIEVIMETGYLFQYIGRIHRDIQQNKLHGNIQVIPNDYLVATTTIHGKTDHGNIVVELEFTIRHGNQEPEIKVKIYFDTSYEVEGFKIPVLCKIEVDNVFNLIGSLYNTLLFYIEKLSRREEDGDIISIFNSLKAFLQMFVKIFGEGYERDDFYIPYEVLDTIMKADTFYVSRVRTPYVSHYVNQSMWEMYLKSLKKKDRDRIEKSLHKLKLYPSMNLAVGYNAVENKLMVWDGYFIHILEFNGFPRHRIYVMAFGELRFNDSIDFSIADKCGSDKSLCQYLAELYDKVEYICRDIGFEECLESINKLKFLVSMSMET